MKEEQNISRESNLEVLEANYNELKMKELDIYLKNNFNDIVNEDSLEKYDLEKMKEDILELLNNEDYISEKEKIVIKKFIEYISKKGFYLKESLEEGVVVFDDGFVF